MKTKQLREGDLLFYSFSRPAVEDGDFRHFLDTFGLEHLPRDQALRSLCNSVVFILDGYDHDTRELYEIPHVRQFCTSFSQAWPFWLFACNLELPSLQAFTFSCLPCLRVIKRDGAGLLRVQYPPQELGKFLEPHFAGMNLLFERAGMTEAENRQRTQQILEFYQRDWTSFAQMTSP